MRFQIVRLVVACFVLAGGVVAAAPTDDFDDLLKMSEQLDQLDRQDFEQSILSAENCTAARDFKCAERHLQKATKVVSGNADKAVLKGAQNYLVAERQAAAREDEQRIAEERRLEKQAAQADLESRCDERCTRPGQLRQCYEGRLEYFRCTDDDGGSQGSSIGLAILGGVNQALAGKAQIDGIHNRAMEQFQAAAEERRRAQAAQRERELAQREENRRTLLAQRQRESEARQQQTRANTQAREQQVALAQDKQRQESAERQRRAEEQTRAQEAAARAQESAAREQRRVADAAAAKAKREQAEADRVLLREAEKQAAAEQARTYLETMARGTQLKARTCYGDMYVVGMRPKVSPEAVPCIDVHYRARCPGSNAYIDGVGSNFIGIATDCFTGDTFETFKIKPTPSCPAEVMQVTVRAVTACKIGRG